MHNENMQDMDDATTRKWEGRYDQAAGWLKEKWGDAVDDASLEAKGNLQQLIGKLKERTGATEEEIHKHLDSHKRKETEAHARN